MAMPSESASCDLCTAGEKARVDNTDRHTLRDIVERHCQHHHRRSLQLAFGAFRLVASGVQMRDHMVKEQQKHDAVPEPDHRREK